MIRRKPGWRGAGWAAPAACAALALAAPSSANAYVRYLTETNQPFHWAEACVRMTGFPNDMPDMTPDQIAFAASEAARVWSKGDLDCTYMQINVDMSMKETVVAKYDRFNTLVFRGSSWCHAENTSGTTCTYDPSALAITSVFVNKRDGRLRDGDIEVNAKYFSWANLVDGGETTHLQDLQNALTHEMGHLIGLDHTCYSLTSDRPRPTDHNGELVADCDKASAEVRETTMFASADEGDITKRTLAPDDQAAVCAIYPAAEEPLICPTTNALPETDDGCYCAAAASTGGRWGALPLALAALLVARRRGRRRGTSV